MAVIDGLPGVEVEVLVDGKPLKEYKDGDQEDGPKSVERYIEATTGKVFGIQLKVAKGTRITRQVVAFGIHIDGVWVHGPFIRAKNFKRVDAVRTSSGRDLGDGQMQQYCFSEIETAKDDRIKHDEASRAKQFGTIGVQVTFEDVDKPTIPHVRSVLTEDSAILSEKALKGRAITHGVGYKAPQPGYSKKATDLKNRDPENVFDFNLAYRSLKALKDMLIIESTPEPLPLEERDFDSLTRDQQKEVHKLFQARAQAEKAAQEAKKKIKRERQDDNPRPRKVARPSAGSQLLEIDDTGDGFRETSTDTLPRVEPEIIEID